MESKPSLQTNLRFVGDHVPHPTPSTDPKPVRETGGAAPPKSRGPAQSLTPPTPHPVQCHEAQEWSPRPHRYPVQSSA